MKAKALMTGLTTLGLVVLLSSGCSRTTPKKPDGSATSQPEIRSGDVAPGQKPSASRESQSSSGPARAPGDGSSLEQLQSGTLGQAESTGPVPDIYFGYDRYDLSQESRATLRDLAGWITKNSEAKIEIEGHCDERGTVEYNLALGAKRAQAAKDYLIGLGVSSNRLSTVSYGEELPLCTESTEECWGKNRRAHFVIVSDSKPIS